MSETRKRRDWYVVRCDQYDVDHYRRILEQSGRLQSAVVTGLKEGGPTFPPLVQDLYNVLYKPAATPNLDLEKQYMVNKTVIEEMQGLPEYEQLHAMTRLDVMGSAIGAASLADSAREILTRLKDEIEEAQQELADAKAEADQNPDDPQAQQAVANAQSRVKQTRDQVRQQAKTALQQAVSEVEDAQDAAETLWGEGQCEATEADLGEKLRLAEEVAADSKFRAIAERFGRIKVISKRCQRLRSRHDAAEIASIELGRDIERMLPTELARLRNPLTALDWKRRFVEGTLMQYRLEENRPKGRGPIVACVDESGSMGGYPNEWAKAVLLALRGIAHAQGRSFAVVHFGDHCSSSPDGISDEAPGIAVRRFPGGKMTAEDTLAMARHFFSGGTDFDVPLTKAMEILDESEFEKGDLIFITDGECDVLPHVMDHLHEVKERKGFHAIGILVGAGAWSDQMAGYFDGTAHVHVDRQGRVHQELDALELALSI